MPLNARFRHTNLIARDWKRLSRFYQEVFGCVPVPPERHLKGRELERGTGVQGAELHGEHLLLPGYDDQGPTLEIFTYRELEDNGPGVVNRPGYGHIAFAVPSVQEARTMVLGAGGSSVGEVVTLSMAGGASVTFCYVTDPEGNIIELQSWSRKPVP